MNDNPDGEKTCVNIEGKDYLIHRALYFSGHVPHWYKTENWTHMVISDNFRGCFSFVRTCGPPTTLKSYGYLGVSIGGFKLDLKILKRNI